MATKPKQTDDVMSFKDAMTAIGLSPYAEQTVMARHMAKVDDKGAIGLIEAPTATGKTLVMAHRAVAGATATGRPCVIAVPTIEVAHQTLAAVNRMTHANETFRTVSAGIVLGRQEFVSIAAVQDLAGTVGEAGRVIANWLAAGGPGTLPGYPAYTRRGLEYAFDIEGVRFEIPDSVSLGPGETDTDAGIAYAAQFDDDRHVVVVTHAMLARDLLSRYIATSRERRLQGMTLDAEPDPAKRWLLANQQRLEVETGDEGRLPDHRRLIVDEAHLLRQNVESAMSTGIAIKPLIRHVTALDQAGSRVVPAGTVTRLKKICDRISKHPLQSPGEAVIINWSDHKGLGDIVQELLDEIVKIKTDRAPAGFEADAVAVSRARYAFQEALRARGAVRTTVEWSPVAAFPTISVGRSFLGGEFRFLWGRLESASLVSATLYTENVAGPSAAHSSARLFIPEARRMTFTPIKADWLIRPVTMMLPTREAAGALVPDDGEGRAAWISAMAARIVAEDGRGTGTLVLSTSRAVTHDLSVEIARGMDAARIIDGTSMRLSAGRARYVALASAGAKPIWLSQGPAWTGLDLPDELLDTLFITRLPYPRREADDTTGAKTGTWGAAQIGMMMMTLKQGIGRLVRTRKAGPKRVFLLDGRIVSSSAPQGALALLRRYAISGFSA